MELSMPIYRLLFCHDNNRLCRRPSSRASQYRPAVTAPHTSKRTRASRQGRNMGLLINGTWHDKWYDTKSTGGHFVRSQSQFRNWVTADGSAGPSGIGGFKAEPGRYHLYVSLACPWASRAMIFRALKGLKDMISVSVVNPYMGTQGWSFEPAPGMVPDPVVDATYLYQIYLRADAHYTGRVTVPVLWDLKQDTM